jgi:predicted nucleic acid-binding protein
VLPSHSPEDVFLDTSFIVNAVFQNLPGSSACIRATDKVILNQSVIYCSELLRLEYAQALRRLATKRRLPQEFHVRFELDRWADANIRHRWLEYGLSELESYLRGLPTVIELPYTTHLFRATATYMAEYSLGSLDAVHLATALHYEIPVFWTCDDHFDRVDEIYVEIIH